MGEAHKDGNTAFAAYVKHTNATKGYLTSPRCFAGLLVCQKGFIMEAPCKAHMYP